MYFICTIAHVQGTLYSSLQARTQELRSISKGCVHGDSGQWRGLLQVNTSPESRKETESSGAPNGMCLLKLRNLDRSGSCQLDVLPRQFHLERAVNLTGCCYRVTQQRLKLTSGPWLLFGALDYRSVWSLSVFASVFLLTKWALPLRPHQVLSKLGTSLKTDQLWQMRKPRPTPKSMIVTN